MSGTDRHLESLNFPLRFIFFCILIYARGVGGTAVAQLTSVRYLQAQVHMPSSSSSKRAFQGEEHSQSLMGGLAGSCHLVFAHTNTYLRCVCHVLGLLPTCVVGFDGEECTAL